MIRITLVDADVGTHAELAELMMNYGKLGYSHAYNHEEFESSEMFLTDVPIEFNKYYDVMIKIGEAAQALERNRMTQCDLTDGTKFFIMKH